MKNPNKEFDKFQKNNTERRCANQRSILANLNVKVSNQQFEINRLKAENVRLKEVLKDIFIIAKRNKSALLATPENNTLSLIENECALALIGESEEK